MKKLLTISLILFSLSAISQTKDSIPPDSINIAALRDISSFNDFLKKNASFDIYTKLTPEQTLQEFARWAVAEWNKKRKPKK